MTDDEQEPWKSLVKAARKAGAGKHAPPETPAPKGFVPHLRAVRKKLWILAKTTLWRRWALVAVAVAAVLYLLAVILLKSDPAPSITPPEPPNPISP
jgi:hypothetical protein